MTTRSGGGKMRLKKHTTMKEDYQILARNDNTFRLAKTVADCS